MQMIHLLPPDPTRVDDGAETIISTLRRRKSSGDGKDRTEEIPVGIIALRQGFHVELRNYQEMHLSQGVYVVKCKNFVILMDFPAGNRSVHDSAEDAGRI